MVLLISYDLNGYERPSSYQAVHRARRRPSGNHSPHRRARPRRQNEGDDAALEREPRLNAKEGAEHAMLVDLARNDLGRCAPPGVDARH
jgi:hypothetical protein